MRSLQMGFFELPDNFCICYSLKKGGQIIAALCLVTSVISCIMLTVYLCSDFDEIAKEIADNSGDMVEALEESKACEYCVVYLFHVIFKPFSSILHLL